MENESVTAISTPPSAANYQALVDRAAAALQSREAGQIDIFAFRQIVYEIDEESRTLQLLHRLHRMRQRLAAQEEKARRPKSPLNS
jgi:hypothetical protein